MPGEDIYSWSTIAADNDDADGLINWAEGQARNSVNNSARSEMAAHAKNRNLQNGSIVTTGSANAQAFLSGNTYTTVPTGMVVKLKVGSGLTNTASMTLNMDGIGAVLVKTTDGANLRGNEFIGGDYVDLLYDGTNWVWLYARASLTDLINGGGGVIIGKQIFNTAGTFTYTPTAGMECCIMNVIAGGGGGGGTVGAALSAAIAAGGGGAGGNSWRVATAADIGASQPVNVGVGGAGGTTTTPAADGGVSTVGVLCGAYGGSGGIGVGQTIPQPGDSNAAGGAGGIAGGVGDVRGTGQAGGAGSYSLNLLVEMPSAGAGGSTEYGGGGRAQSCINTIGLNGLNGSGFGSGGSGGASCNGGNATIGGNGAPGLVIITEFAGRGAPGHDGIPGAPGAPGAQGPQGPSGPGTGDVLRSGSPSVDQVAVWVDGSHIKGVAPNTILGFSTGDAKLTLKAVADPGWVFMNDGTIGSASSGSSTRANADTQALFTLLFNNIVDAAAPILTSTGAPTTRAALGNNAATGWAANCRMTLPRQLGRGLAVAGAGAGLTAHALGGFDGSETHALAIGEMPSHSHAVVDPGHAHVESAVANSTSADVFPGSEPKGVADSSGPTISGTSTQLAATGITIQPAGGGSPMNILNPRAYWNIMIKL